MYPSGALCRAQEFLKRERSTGAALANVRQVAHKAANASGTEALLAEQREQCQVPIDGGAAGPKAEERGQREQLDRSLSENPDRGLACA